MSMNEHSSAQDTDSSTFTSFRVSTIDVSLAKASHKTIHSITITLKKEDGSQENVEHHVSVGAGQSHRAEFQQPLDFDPKGHISVSANCSWFSLKGKQDIPIDIDLRGKCRDEGQGVRSYRNKARNVEIVVIGRLLVDQSLSGDVSDILESCPRFRLLVIGNSGVGKSSLIQNVFGVKEVLTSDNGRGITDIDREFVSPTNERFVVHDSLGFEAGDQQNMYKVEDFVTRRKTKPQLTDQLHAVWLCLDIPHAGGRLLEGGVEMFLQRRKQILGEIPLVAVLTKVDKLDIQLELDPPKNEDVEQYKTRYLNEKCIEPLRRAAGHDVPCVIVSVLDDYSHSLPNLVTTTLQSMTTQNVHQDPRAVVTIAQRVSIKEKIELSVDLGKKKYRSLVWNSAMSDDALRRYLQDMRKNVVIVWNFNDPDEYLMNDTFTGTLLRTDNLGTASQSPFKFRSLAQALVTVLPTGLPIASVVTSEEQFSFGSFLGATKYDAKILMAYIVDLISAMQIIFLLALGNRVTDHMVALALGAYEEPRKTVHEEVDRFAGKPSRDCVMDEVERLVWLYSIGDHEIKGLRQKIQPS